MDVIIIPIIPWHRDSENELIKALSEIRPKHVILDSSPNEEPDNLYAIPLTALGVFSEKNYTDVVENLKEEFNFNVIDLSPTHEEILLEVSSKAHVTEIIRYNMLLRKLKRPPWRETGEFLRWMYKAFYRIDIMRGEAYAFSKKVLKKLSEIGDEKVAIVCDFLMMKALLEVMGDKVDIYKDFTSRDLAIVYEIVKTFAKR